VRADGGYVIAAPSKHASGREYAWEVTAHPAEVPLAELPRWLATLAGTNSRHEHVDPGGAGTTIIGQRNEALTRLAGAMRRPGIGERAILAALLIVNDEQCRPPLKRWEVEKIAKSVSRYPAGAPVEGGPDPFPMLFGADLARPLPPVPWVCEKLGIVAGAVTIVGGAGFGGKTVSMQSLALSVASGTKLWGQFDVKHGKVIHYDLEQGPYLTTERYQRLSRSMNVDLSQIGDYLGVSCLPRMRFDSEGAEDQLVRMLDGVSVCIIDAFRGAFPSAKENDSECRKYLDMLQMVSERTGSAMIVIAHSRKSSDTDDIRSSLRGSSAMFDAGQTVYMLDGAPRKPTRVHNTKDRKTGETRETFGLEIRDEIGDDGDRRWGLDVHYLAPCEVQAAYMRDDSAANNDMALNAERMSSLGRRVLEIAGRSSDGVIVSTLQQIVGASASQVKAVVDELVWQRVVEREANLIRVVRMRYAGED
jgi:hypothetical protein